MVEFEGNEAAMRSRLSTIEDRLSELETPHHQASAILDEHCSNIIGPEAFIAGHEGQRFQSSLSNEHSVERIAVMSGKIPGSDGMGDADRKLSELAGPKLDFKVVWRS